MGLEQEESTYELLGVQGDEATAILKKITPASVAELASLEYGRLIVYSTRSSTVSEYMAANSKSGICYSIKDAIAAGQAGV